MINLSRPPGAEPYTDRTYKTPPSQQRLPPRSAPTALPSSKTPAQSSGSKPRRTASGWSMPTRTAITASVLTYPSSQSGGPRTPPGSTPPAAGVDTDQRGYVRVDSTQRTSAPHIFAAGDITGRAMLVHEAVQEAQIAATNAALDSREPLPEHVNPVGSFTDPEYASVGLTEAAARADYDALVVSVDFDGLPRPIIDGRPYGFCKGRTRSSPVLVPDLRQRRRSSRHHRRHRPRRKGHLDRRSTDRPGRMTCSKPRRGAKIARPLRRLPVPHTSREVVHAIRAMPTMPWCGRVGRSLSSRSVKGGRRCSSIPSSVR